MAGYRSKLQGILLHLKFQEEFAQNELAESNRKLTKEEEILNSSRLQMAETSKSLLEKQATGIHSNELELYQKFINHQRKKVEEQEKTVQSLLREYEAKREKLAHAAKEKKVVQKIENVRWQTYVKKVEKKDQQAMDEIAGQLKGNHG